jgi:large subunit ribosomal protein L18e
MKRTGPTNSILIQLINDLKKLSNTEKVAIWKRVALDLEKPTRNRRAVNLSRINQNTKEKETIIVPGKVLSNGELNHEITIAAFSFSKKAKEFIEKSKGKAITINELMKQNPKGKNIKIIG